MCPYNSCCQLKPCGDGCFAEQQKLKSKEYVETAIDIEDYYKIKEGKRRKGKL